MLFQTLADDYLNLSKFSRFFIVPDDVDSGYLLIAQYPCFEFTKTPQTELLGGVNSRLFAQRILDHIMTMMALKEPYCSMRETIESLGGEIDD